jgi:hypothetical protein
MQGNDNTPRRPHRLAVLALAGAALLGGCAAFGGDYGTAYNAGWSGPGAYDTYPDGAYFSWAGSAFGPDGIYGGYRHDGYRHDGYRHDGWHDAGLHNGGLHNGGLHNGGWHGGATQFRNAGRVGLGHIGGHLGGHIGGFAAHGGSGRA